MISIGYPVNAEVEDHRVARHVAALKKARAAKDKSAASAGDEHMNQLLLMQNIARAVDAMR